VDETTRTMRADAVRNRIIILEAAEAVLARDGLDASMRSIALEAGVGIGTLYRHFATQEDLYRAIMQRRLAVLIDQGREIDREAELGDGFFRFLTLIVINATRSKALADALSDAGLDPKDGLAQIGTEMRAQIEALLLRSQSDGVVRRDVELPEMLSLLGALCLGAERNQWTDERRTSALSVVFDGLGPRNRRLAN
jgi:AcrR family transcriptional regulator